METQFFPKTVAAIERLQATIRRMDERQDNRAREFLARHGMSFEDVRAAALARSADFQDPRVGVRVYVESLFPQPSPSRVYVRASLCRSLGMSY